MIFFTFVTQHIKRVLPARTDIRAGMHPQRDWLIGLLLCMVMVGVGSVVLSRLYFSYQAVGTMRVTDVPQVTRYKEEVVNDAIVVYRQRSQQYDALLLNADALPIVVDVAVSASTTAEIAPPSFEEASSTAE